MHPMKFWIWGGVLEVVTYFKLHEMWLRGLCAVGSKLQSPIDLAVLAHGLYDSL